MTSATNPKTIVLGGANTPVLREGIATGVITPGMLIEAAAGQLLGAGADVAAHATADQQAQSAWAVEFAMTGRGIDDNYEVGDQVQYIIAEEGVGLYAILASGQSVADGAKLASAGNGRLKAAAADDFVVAVARETVDASGAAARIRVEVSRGRTAP